MYEELKARLLAWTKTSSSFGLDSIGKDIAAALEAIEQLDHQLAEHQSRFEIVRNELDKTKVFANAQASAAAHWIEKHDAIEAQFAQYRDAPVVAYLYKYHNCFGDEVWTTDINWGNRTPLESKSLIVKPGE